MELKIKNKVLILTYKTLFEEHSLVDIEVNDGQTDLNYYLEYFKKRLDCNHNKDQKNIFNNIFFKNRENNIPVPVNQKNNMLDNPRDLKNKNQKKPIPRWAKSLYKKIVSVTHPDKLQKINIDFLVSKLIKRYLLAVSSYKEEKYQNLIMIAFDLEIEFDDKLVELVVKPALSKLEKEIKSKKTLLGYQWYHVPENKKEETLESYLNAMGFVFTKNEISEAIKKVRFKNKRKPGTRPKRHIKFREKK